MPTIDERIVQMQFDNQQFERGVSKSLSTLEKLKQALQFDKVGSSLEKIQNSFNNINLSGLEENIEKISDRFTFLGNLGQTAMRRISDSAIDAAKNIFNMVSGINNIKAGEAKYQTRTKAVQTITNATGKSVAEVEKILDRLQQYTDETSADFTEMVNSIGKFTSVGIELETAEKAMEGISNEAYKSGASRMEAGRAMYNFAQALSSGAVKLIDWKSIENANMATKEFKEELIKTAIELGTISKKTDTVGKIMKQTKKATKKSAAEFKETEVSYKSFNSTLSEGWLTSDVLIKTLNRYADTTTEIGASAFAAAKEYLTFGDVMDTIADTVSSSWMRTFQAIFGNLDEARKLWTRVGDSIVDLFSVFSEYRVSLVENWHEMGGYEKAIEAASNLWHTFRNIVLGVKEALEKVFPPITAERLVDITEKIRKATEQLLKTFGLYEEAEEGSTGAVSETTPAMKRLQNIVTGWASTLKVLINSLKAMGKIAKSLIDMLMPIIKVVARLVSMFSEMRQNFIEALEEGDVYSKFANTIINVLKPIGDFLLQIAKSVELFIATYAAFLKQTGRKNTLGNFITFLAQYIKTFTNFGFIVDIIEIAIKSIKSFVSLIKQTLNFAATKIKAFGEQWGWIRNFDQFLFLVEYYLSKIPFVGRIIKSFEGNLLIGLKNRIVNFVLSVIKAFKAGDVNSIADFFKVLYSSFKEAIKGTKLGDFVDTIEGVIGVVISILDRARKTILSVIETVTGKVSGFVNEWKFMFAGIDQFLFTIEYFLSKIPIIGSLFRDSEGAFNGDILIGIKNKLVEFVTGVTDAFKSGDTRSIKNFADSLIDNFKSSKLGGLIFNYLDSLSAVIGEFIKSIDQLVFSVVNGGKQSIGNASKVGIGGLLESLLTIVIKVNRFISGFLNDLNNSGTLFSIGQLLVSVFRLVSTFGEMLYNEISNLLGIVSNGEVKSGFSGFLSTISKFIGGLAKGINLFLNTYRKFLEATGKQNTISTFIDFTARYLSVNGSKIGDAFGRISPIISKFLDFIKNIFTEIGKAFGGREINSITDFFKVLWEGLTNAIPILGKVSDIIVPILSGLIRAIIDFLEKFSSAFKNKDINSFSDFFIALFEGLGKAIPIETIFKELSKRVVSAFYISVSWISTKFSEIINGTFTALSENNPFGKLINNIQSFFGKVPEETETMVNTISGAVDSTKTAISDLAVSAKETGKNTITNVKNIISNIINGIMKLFWPVLTAITVKSFNNFSKGFITFSKGFEKISEDFGKNISEAIEVFKGRAIKRDTIGTTFIKITASVAGLVVAVGGMIALLSTIKPEDLDKALMVMLKISVGFISITGILTLLQKFLGGIGDIGTQMLKFTGSISILAVGIFMLTNILKWGFKPENVIFMLGAITGIVSLLLAFAGLEIVLAKIAASSDSGNANAYITGILDMCKGILLITVALAGIAFVFSHSSAETIASSVGLLSGIIVILGAIMVALGYFAQKSDSGIIQSSIKGMTGLAVAILLIVFAMGEIALGTKIFGSGAVWSAFTMIFLLLSAMGSIAVLIQKEDTEADEMKQKSIALAISIGVMTASLSISAYTIARLGDSLSKIPFNVVIAELAGMFLIISAMGTIAILFQKFANSGKDGILTSVGLVISMVGMAVAVGMVAEALSKSAKSIRNVPWQNLLIFFGSIIVMIGALAGISLLMRETSITALIATGAGIAAALALIGLGIGLLGSFAGFGIEAASQALWIMGSDLAGFSDNISNIDWDSVGKVVKFMTVDLLSMWSTIVAINFQSFYDSIVLLSRAGSQIKLFGVNVSSITQETIDASSRIIVVLQNVSQAMAEASNIVIPESISNGRLTNLGASLSNYSAMIMSINATAEVSSMAKTIATDAVDISNAISQISTATTAEETLTELGSALNLYYGMLSEITTDEDGNVQIPTIDSQMISQAFEALTSAIPEDKIEMLASYASGGGNDMTQVALGINALGEALKSYGEDIGSLETTSVSNANDVLEALGNLNSALNPRDIFGNILGHEGEKTFSSFADDITSLGTALKSYGESIGGIDGEKVKSANSILELLMKLDSQLQLDNSFSFNKFFSFLNGDEQTLSTFSGDVTLLAEALGTYGTEIGKINPTEVTNANNVVNAILTASRNIPASGGLLSKLFIGDNSLGGFASNIKNLADGIGQYADRISSSKFDNVQDSIDFFTKLVGMMGNLEKTGGIGSWFTGDKKLSSVAKGLGDLGSELGDFKINSEGVKYEDVEGALKVVETIIGWMDLIGNNQVYDASTNQTMDSLDYIVTKVHQTLSQLTDIKDIKASDGKSIIESLASIGNSVTTTLSDGIKSEDSIVYATDAMATVMDAVNEKVRSYYDTFLETGKYVVQGLVAGLTDAMSLEALRNAGVTLAVIPTDANRDELKVKSPSREFEWTGQMCALGLKNGISEYGYLVKDSAVDLATATLSGIMGAFDTNKLGDVSRGAMEAVSGLFIKPKGEKYTKEDKNLVKQLMVVSGYLNESDFTNIDKVKEAVIGFKKEVLGMKGEVNSSWGSDEGKKLYNVLNRQAIKNGSYDKVQYEKELKDAIGESSVITVQYNEKNRKNKDDNNTKVNKEINKEIKKGNEERKIEAKTTKKNNTKTKKEILRSIDRLIDSRKNKETFDINLKGVKKNISDPGLMTSAIKKDIETIDSLVSNGSGEQSLKEASQKLAVDVGNAADSIVDINEETKKNNKETKKNNKETEKNNQQGLKRTDPPTDILAVQDALEKFGYLEKGKYIRGHVVNGHYDPTTADAVIKFQREALGIVDYTPLDPKEFRKAVRNIVNDKQALNEVKSHNRVDTTKTNFQVSSKYDQLTKDSLDYWRTDLKRGDKGKLVKQLQKKLIKYGYLDPGEDDGIFGPKTQAAIRSLQEDLKLTNITGVWDQGTRYTAVVSKKIKPGKKKGTNTSSDSSDSSDSSKSSKSSSASSKASKSSDAWLDEWTKGFEFTGDADPTAMMNKIVENMDIGSITSNILGDTKDGSGLLGGLFKGIMDPEKGIGSMITGAFDIDTDGKLGIWQSGIDVGGEMLSGVTEAITGGDFNIVDTFKGIFFDENGNFKIPGSEILSSVKEIFSGAGAALTSALGESTEDGGSVLEKLGIGDDLGGVLLSGITGYISTNGGTIWQSIITALTNSAGTVDLSGLAGTLGTAFSGALSGGADSNVTVTPVIDSTDFETKLGSTLTDLISGNSSPVVSIGTSLDSANAISKGIQTDIQAFKTANDDNNAKMLGKFDELKGKIDALDNDILNMKIYLDSDALVVGTVAKYDRALASRIAARKGYNR